MTETPTPHHDELCPRYRLLCTCEDCGPPPCLCELVAAVLDGNKQELYQAFWRAHSGK